MEPHEVNHLRVGNYGEIMESICGFLPSRFHNLLWGMMLGRKQEGEGAREVHVQTNQC